MRLKKSNKSVLILFLSFMIALGGQFTSCKTGEGCPNQAEYKADMDSSKRGKSTLFSKKQKKKKRK